MKRALAALRSRLLRLSISLSQSERENQSVELKRDDSKEYDFRQYVIPRIVSMVNKYGTTTESPESIRKWIYGN